MKPRMMLLLVGAACLAPVVLATMAYHFDWVEGDPGNYGELIAPQPLSGAPLDALRGKWVLVSFDAPACDAHCEKKLYYMRQVRKAQGKEQARVERLWILTGAGAPRPELLQAIEGTHVSPRDPGGFPGRPEDHIYLVDPLGNLMLRFPRDPDPALMLKDVKRLLKYSRVG